jgi:hypothetical protein
MMLKRRYSLWLFLVALVAGIPVLGLDFHSWRSDGFHVFGSSVGQQSSNLAFNAFESLFDIANTNLGLYWKGGLQWQGGLTTGPWGNSPPTQGDSATTPYLRDNREQDPIPQWATWHPVATKTPGFAPPLPKFTPNLPQGWGPVALDLDDGTGTPDPFLIGVGFDAPRVGGGADDRRDQILNAYFPQTVAGMPFNSPSAPAPGQTPPLWARPNDDTRRGLLIRDLEPLRTASGVLQPGVGVVTHPPILARVPGLKIDPTDPDNPRRIAKVVPVVYLVVGTGEAGDFARIICVNLDGTLTRLRQLQANRSGGVLLQTDTVEGPDPDYFDPDFKSGSYGGDVLWSYKVTDLNGSPDPVAGISFANIGDANAPKPVLFVTTRKGRLICLNAKASDRDDVAQDGDSKIEPSDASDADNKSKERWTFLVPNVGSPPTRPGFHYGMAPAACRVPLAGSYRTQTVQRALSTQHVDEWMVFVADSWGIFRAFDAGGQLILNNAGKAIRHDPRVRWVDAFYVVDAMGNKVLTQRPSPINRLPERFIVPPLVYQGGTPLTQSNGAIVSGSSDVGFDDEVIFASERGRLYALDAMGTLLVSSDATEDGKPLYEVQSDPAIESGTAYRWRWPDINPATPLPGSSEPPAWPRELPDRNDADLNVKTLGKPIPQNVKFFSRGPLAGALGSNTNPNSGTPNLDPGDDAIFVPYAQDVTDPATTPAGYKALYEYVGSLAPYGFVQMTRPVESIVAITSVDGVRIPLEYVRIGTVKGNGLPSNRVPNTANYDPPAPAPNDTIYITRPTFFDTASNKHYTLPFGKRLSIRYRAPDPANPGQTQALTESAPYPSCHRLVLKDPNGDPVDPANQDIVRTRASLAIANARLELRRTRRDPTTKVFSVIDEKPALVLASEFDDQFVTSPPNLAQYRNNGLRQPGMYAAGTGNTAGLLLAPTWFRGRVIALTHRLRIQRALLGCYDPRLEPGVAGPPGGFGPPVPPYGPAKPAGTPPELINNYDPGEFYTPTGADVDMFLDDEPACTDVGSSVTLVDGWLYITYRNGHIRAYANEGGGAGGTVGGFPPIFTLPPPIDNGNLVRAPSPDFGGGIHILVGKTLDDVRSVDANGKVHIRTSFLDRAASTLDRTVLLEWGQTLFVAVDFGPASQLVPQQTIDPNSAGSDIDSQVLENEVQGQIRSSNGAVQQLPGVNRGVRPEIAVYDDATTGMVGDHVVAIVPVFAGVPSASNPLTPGTPLLWERDPASADWNFTGQLTYDIQITQQGLQWRWPNDAADAYDGRPRPPKQHFWEIERNDPNRPGVRFPNTGGKQTFSDPNSTPNWAWGSEWAPLMSYNNPIIVRYRPAAVDPVDGSTPLHGMIGPSNNGVDVVPFDPATGSLVDEFNRRLQPGRKNADQYPGDYVDGSRSGSGRPITPTVGLAVRGNSQATVRQVLFVDHGKTSPASSTVYPDLARLQVGDRSYLGMVGRGLQLRVQPAALTKIGRGTFYGAAQSGDATLQNPNGAPQGSFQQNAGYNDDAPDQFYPSIPQSRMVVTKSGSNLDVTSNPVQVPGRRSDGTFPSIVDMSWLETLGVQIDVPPYTPDDIYATRWRSALPAGSPPGSSFNPFWPMTIFGEGPRMVRDRAERLRSAPTIDPAGPEAVALRNHGEDPGPDGATDSINADYDDRARRAVIFNDANGNGILDLLPNYREAYRTFAVQVVVKPDPKMEAQQQVLDLGSPWHGKKQPGLGAGALEMREWQKMQTLPASLQSYYRQYWRPFNLLNTGTVNLAYVKPEVAFQAPGTGVQILAIPGEGNDPWRALPLINQTTNAALQDPFQIFLRTSFDDQLMRQDNVIYGSSTQGVWLQKAAVGAGAPGSVAFADRRAAPSGAALDRDPSVTQPDGTRFAEPRDTWMSLNLPTGTPLGQYSGSLRFYNDRSVRFAEVPNSVIGYQYVSATGLPPNGTLERDNLLEPMEPSTDPPLKLKVRVMEDMVQGRVTADNTGQPVPDVPDRRMMPAVAPDVSAGSPAGAPQGTVGSIKLVYPSNRNDGLIQSGSSTNAGAALHYELFGTQISLDPSKMLFQFDELPLDRAPWQIFAPPNSNPPYGWTELTPGLASNVRATRPTLSQDFSASGYPMLLSWVEQTTNGPGSDTYVLRYAELLNNGATGAIPHDPRVPVTDVRVVPVGNNTWLAVFAQGTGVGSSLGYSFATSLAGAGNWVQETSIATSPSLSSVRAPQLFVTDPLTRAPAPLTAPPGTTPPAFIQQEYTQLPKMAWVSYSGISQGTGRSDIYLNRMRTAALAQQAARGTGDPLTRAEDYGLVGFPRFEAYDRTGGPPTATGGDLLVGNPSRTQFTGAGTNWLISPHSKVQVYISRPDIPFGQAGSVNRPVKLINDAATTGAPVATNGELVFSGQYLDPAIQGNANLQDLSIMIDAGAGVVRFNMDTRRLARLAMPSPGFGTQSPDPLITADYTPGTLRLTRGDVAANDPVVVPVLSPESANPDDWIYDASWYRQALNPTAMASGFPIRGRADRLWVFWRRAAGTVGGGPTCFYKVLRPGIRTNLGALFGITPAELTISIGGRLLDGAALPLAEEVNPQTGSIYLPSTYEGQLVEVTYRAGDGRGFREQHRVTWLDETGERPIPMETSVNEGSLDAFASYENVVMYDPNLAARPNTRHLEKNWLFWSSTRSSFGDIYSATLAPRIGLDVNVAGSIVRTSGGALPARLSGEELATFERRHPAIVPPISRRGPYVPTMGSRR